VSGPFLEKRDQLLFGRSVTSFQVQAMAHQPVAGPCYGWLPFHTAGALPKKRGEILGGKVWWDLRPLSLSGRGDPLRKIIAVAPVSCDCRPQLTYRMNQSLGSHALKPSVLSTSPRSPWRTTPRPKECVASMNRTHPLSGHPPGKGPPLQPQQPRDRRALNS